MGVEMRLKSVSQSESTQSIQLTDMRQGSIITEHNSMQWLSRIISDPASIPGQHPDSILHSDATPIWPFVFDALPSIMVIVVESDST